MAFICSLAIRGTSTMWRLQAFSNRSPWNYGMRRLHELPELSRPVDLPEGEVWSEEGNNINFPSSVWQLNSHEGGRSLKPDKAYTDLLLLQEDRKDMPDDQRTVYHLAQQYENVGCKAESLHHHKLCTKMGGAVYQRYISYVNLIRSTDDLRKKLKWGWKAVQLDPWRLEAPYYLLLHSRTNALWLKEIVAMAMVCAVKNPKRVIMPHMAQVYWEEIYTWRFSDEYGICLYWGRILQRSIRRGSLSIVQMS